MSGQIKVSFEKELRVIATAGKWDIATDQEEKDGGGDSAPNPFQLFLASLATCAGFYAMAFCEKRKISTQGLGLTLDYDWDKKEGRVVRMSFVIDLPRGFPEKYHKALVRAVDACTVKKHLVNPPEMTTYTRVRSPQE